jgi:hypothetical protein
MMNTIIIFQGEEQKKLDVLSNQAFVKALVGRGRTGSPSYAFFSQFRLKILIKSLLTNYLFFNMEYW